MRFETTQAGQTELATLHHEGQAFTAAGSSTAGEHVTAYDTGGSTLSSFTGRTLIRGRRVEPRNCRRYPEGAYPVAFQLPSRRGRAMFLVGYSLGQGMLFRGELKGYRIDPYDSGILDDVRADAIAAADYWADRDEEDRQQDEYDQAQDDE